MIRKIILLVGVFAGSLSWVSGQVYPDPPNQVYLIQDHYQSAVHSKLEFVNGTLYQDVYPGATGHPFLGNGGWSEGTIRTNEKTFEGLQLRYDLVRDLLIYNHIIEAGIFAVNLNKERIEEFTLHGHRFIHYRSGTTDPQDKNKSQIAEPGFYEEITRGSVSLYVKWVKHYEPPSSTGNGRFTHFQHICIMKGDSLLRIPGKRGLLRVMKDQEKPVRKFIREQGITLHGNDPAGYQQVVEYYNALQP